MNAYFIIFVNNRILPHGMKIKYLVVSAIRLGQSDLAMAKHKSRSGSARIVLCVSSIIFVFIHSLFIYFLNCKYLQYNDIIAMMQAIVPLRTTHGPPVRLKQIVITSLRRTASTLGKTATCVKWTAPTKASVTTPPGSAPVLTVTSETIAISSTQNWSIRTITLLWVLQLINVE